jgi:hypothetical protein
MKLGEHQEAFMEDVLILGTEALRCGYKMRGGELWRPTDMQIIYVQTGKSKTMDSEHLNKCAIDIHFTKDGIICYPEHLGKFWECLNERNRWGGSWRGLIEAGKSNFKDLPHFERRTK